MEKSEFVQLREPYSVDASLTVILIAAIVAGLYMAWAIGATDVANSMGASGVSSLPPGGQSRFTDVEKVFGIITQ